MSRELRLLLASAKIGPAAADEDAIRQILASGIDWGRFAQLAVNHGLAGFCGQTLCRAGGDLPDDVRDALRVVIEHTRKSNSILCDEFALILDSLRSSSIETIPMKDLMLAMQSYGDLGLRTIGALDFLVPDADVAAAIAALERLGYAREASLTVNQQQMIRHVQGRDLLINRNKQIAVRPHTRFAPLHLAVDIDYAGIWQRAKPGTINNLRLTLLAPEDQLLSLVLRGSKDFWRQVISACDVTTFIHRHPGLDWPAIVERARAQGCLRMTVLAASLVRCCFNAELPERINSLQQNDKALESMTAHIVSGWNNGARNEPARPGAPLKELVLLHDGLGRRAHYLLRKLHIPEPADVDRIALPRQLNFAYVPLAFAHERILLPLRKMYRDTTRHLSPQFRSQSSKLSWDFAQSRGTIAPEQAEFEKSRARALDLLLSDSRNIAALHELARALFGLDRLEDAIEAYQRLIKSAPANIPAKEEFARVLVIMQRFNDAVRMAEEVIGANPDSDNAYAILGDAHRNLGRYGEAAAAYNKSLDLRPNSAGPIGGLGLIFLESGEIQRARRLLAEAMALEPENVTFLFNIVTSGKVATGDPVLKNLDAMNARAASLSPRVREMMHFALAKACGDTGAPERGFAHLLEGNALHRRRTNYDEKLALHNLDLIRNFFGRAMFTQKHPAGLTSEIPVFVVGMPRSGSTLIEQIIASHPGAFGAGESLALPALLAQRGILRRGTAISEQDLAAATTPAGLLSLGEQYLRRVINLAPHAARIVDKQLGNFAHAGLIHLALPNAKIIHARRSPLDTCLSCFNQVFSEGNLEYTYDLGELGRFYQAYRALMEHWKAVLPATVMLEVDYETVVRDFANTARKIIAHCGLEWNDSCLAFHETRKPVQTASIVQVRQPLYQTSIGRWRPDKDILRPLMESLGEESSATVQPFCLARAADLTLGDSGDSRLK